LQCNFLDEKQFFLSASFFIAFSLHKRRDYLKSATEGLLLGLDISVRNGGFGLNSDENLFSSIGFEVKNPISGNKNNTIV